MLNFIATVLLAIIIFVPATLLISKLFRLSAQGEDSFNDLVKEIEDLAENGEDESHTILLIMDEQTLIIGYNAQQDAKLCLDLNLCTIAPYPEKCAGKSCICLCREFTSQGVGFQNVGTATSGEITCSKQNCIPIKKASFPSNFPLSNIYLHPNALNSCNDYTCVGNSFVLNGFIIGRSGPESSTPPLDFSGLNFRFSENRRMLFHLLKRSSALDSDWIYISKDAQPHFYSNIGEPGEIILLRRRCGEDDLTACHSAAVAAFDIDRDMAISFFDQNCQNGYSESCRFLAHHYWPTATARARPYYERACELENWQACEEWGNQWSNYYHNTGQASHYYSLACAGGRESACTLQNQLTTQ